MTTAKMKIATAFLLAAYLVGSASFALRVRPQEQAKSASSPPKVESEKPKTDLYGDPLPEGALARLGTVRWRHGSQVQALAYSSDGKMLASGSMDEAIHLWNAKTGRLLRILRGHEAWVDSVFFTRDNKQVISCGQDKSARVWDASTGKELRRWTTKGGWKLTLSPDGKTLAGIGSFPARAAIFLWDVATGNKVGELPFEGVQDFPFDMAYSPDGKRLVSAGSAVRFFDLAAGKQSELFGSGKRISSVAFSPDGKMLAVGRDGQPVTLWDTATLKELRRLDGDRRGARAIAFAPDGKTLAVAAHGPLALWDPATGKKLRDLPGTHYQVWSMTFSPDSKTLAVGNLDSMIHLYDTATGKELPTSAGGHRQWLSFVAFVDRDRSVISVSSEGLVRQWDLATVKAAREFREQGTHSYCGDLSPDGRTLASGEQEGAHLFDWATGRKLRVLKGNKYQLWAVAFSPKGDMLAFAGNLDPNILLADVATGRELRRIPTPFVMGIPRLAWSPNGKVLASAGVKINQQGEGFDTICVSDPNGKQLGEWTAHGPSADSSIRGATALAFSPDGALLASAGADKTIGLWNAATGTLRTRLLGHQRGATAVAFSPDGRMLASGSRDRTVRLWELATGKERRRYEGHLGAISKLAFTADGRILASAGGDTSVLVWSVTGRDSRQRQPDVTLAPRRLEELWSDLASDDASRAWRAACTLAAASQQTLPWIEKHVRAASLADTKRIARLIADLDSRQFATRQQAARELEKLGELAEPALRKTLDEQPSAEVRRRAERLLANLDGLVQIPEVLRGLRAIEVLEQIGTAQAQRQLERLVHNAPGRRMKKESKAAVERLTKRTAR